MPGGAGKRRCHDLPSSRCIVTPIPGSIWFAHASMITAQDNVVKRIQA